MGEINAVMIQEELEGRCFVTVPWIQMKYGLDYTEAKAFLQHLIRRGWVEPNADGIQYPILHDNLCLRRLTRDEVDPLIANVTSDCVSALHRIQKNMGMGASYSELSSAVRGDDDITEAVKILTDHKLIYLWDNLYFTMVSKETVSVLAEMVRAKRHAEVGRRMADITENVKSIKSLFDVLFDD